MNKLSANSLVLFLALMVGQRLRADIITFEDVAFPSGQQYYNGADPTLPNPGFKSTPWTSAGVSFSNYYGKDSFSGFDYDYWGDFAASSVKNTITSGFTNQYAAYTPASPGAGAGGSNKYAVFFGSSTPNAISGSVQFQSDVNLQSMQIANTTYAALSMKNGDGFADKFKAGDFMELTIYGYLNNAQVGSKTIALADFRDGKSSILSDWLGVSFSGFSIVDELRFSFNSSNKGTFGINTPTYFALDNLIFDNVAAVPEPSSILLLSLSGAAGLGYRWRKRTNRQ